MVFSSRKRFIAGACCPTCQAQDVIVVFHRDGRDWRACVACGLEQVMEEQAEKGLIARLSSDETAPK